MHLVYRSLQGDKVPSELPEELGLDKVPKPISAVPNINGTPKPVVSQTSQPGPAVEAIPWVVNAGDRYRYNVLFKQTDSDKDGFVSGIEIKNVFLQTGLPQNILAHIWNLCDINQEGKLNPEQFALAMWFIQRKQAGRDPPAA
jgi:epidermal growth factor receptor substrate 15